MSTLRYRSEEHFTSLAIECQGLQHKKHTVSRDARQQTTSRNLRIREDTAKYLFNLDVDSAFYDPKSRSLRDNPMAHLPEGEQGT